MPVCIHCSNTFTRVDNNGSCRVCRDAVLGNEPIVPGISNEEFNNITELPNNWINEPLQNLNGGHILKIMMLGSATQNTKIDDVISRVEVLEKSSNDVVIPLVTQVKLLEKELQDKTEKIDTLTNIIINMQKSINMIDFEERSTNIMISGLSETNITVGSDPETSLILKTDVEKVKHVLDVIDADVNYTHVRDCTRIGKPKANYTRLLKIKVTNKDQRKILLDNSSKLKAHGHLKKVYIKKDTHPVYVQETNRLRAKMKELQAIPANKDKVKIVDSKLELDGVIIDRNTFFV